MIHRIVKTLPGHPATRERSVFMAQLMYLLGFICLLLAPFTGITVVGAAAFFVIGWIIDHA